MFAYLFTSLCAALPPLAFVPIVAGDHAPTDGARVHAAVVEAIEARPLLLEAVPYNQLLVESQSISVSTVRDCGADATCIARVFEGRALKFIVVAAVNFELEPWSAAISVIDPRTRRANDRLVPLAATDGAQLEREIGRATADFLEAEGAVRAGRVVVEVEPNDAEVRAPSALESIGRLRYLGPPGAYELHARADGYEPRHITLEVAAGQEAQARLALEPTPGLLAEPWFWIVSGAAVAVVAGGVTAAVLLSNGGDPEVCFTTAGRGCP